MPINSQQSPGWKIYLQDRIDLWGHGSNAFIQSAVVSSAVEKLSPEETGWLVNVPRIKPEKILALLPGPYDLVKVDIEGSEFDFLQHYLPVLQATSYLLLEWCSWHSGGGGLEQLLTALKARGFSSIKEVCPPKTVLHHGMSGQCGLLLFKRD